MTFSQDSIGGACQLNSLLVSQLVSFLSNHRCFLGNLVRRNTPLLFFSHQRKLWFVCIFFSIFHSILKFLFFKKKKKKLKKKRERKEKRKERREKRKEPFSLFAFLFFSFLLFFFLLKAWLMVQIKSIMTSKMTKNGRRKKKKKWLLSFFFFFFSFFFFFPFCFLLFLVSFFKI